MALVEWTEDYGQYKKGDRFPLNDAASRQYLVETGKIKVVDENYVNETVSQPLPTEEEQAEADKAVLGAPKPAKKESK